MILTPTNPFSRLGRWRYSLRSLLLAVTAIAIFLAWWTTPFDVVEYDATGDPMVRFRVRRDWCGNQIAAGEQLWLWQDGKVFERREIWGARRDGDEFKGPGQIGPSKRWNFDGTPLSSEDGPGDQPDFEALIWLISRTIDTSSRWDEFPAPSVPGISEFRHGGGQRLHDTDPIE
jgi:hypothetical protein